MTKQINEEDFHTIISQIIVGMMGAVKANLDDVPQWASAVLRDNTPGKKRDHFLLADHRGYGIFGHSRMCLLLNVPSRRPILFTMAIGTDDLLSVFRVDGMEVSSCLDIVSAFSRMKERLGFVPAESCPNCGTEFVMGSAQRFCEKCGQQKA